MKSTSAHFILFQYLNSFKKFLYYAVLYLASSYIKWTRNIS